MWVALHLRAQRESSADGGSGVPRILELDFANGHSVGGIIYNGKNQGFPNLGKWPCIKRGMSRKWPFNRNEQIWTMGFFLVRYRKTKPRFQETTYFVWKKMRFPSAVFSGYWSNIPSWFVCPLSNECYILFKVEFSKAVPQIKYDHTLKSKDFNWRRWTSIFFPGKLVVLVVLVVIGVQHVVCVPFCTSRFYERCNKERERGRERGIGRDRKRERERKREKHRTRKRERER